MTKPSQRPLPTLTSTRTGYAIVGLTIAVIIIAMVRITPPDETNYSENTGTENIPLPDLTSTGALSAWHGNPLENQKEKSNEARQHLAEAWNDFRGKFSPLPKFEELPATFRVRSLAAGFGEDKFTIAMHSGWDAETITEKLRPFRNQLNSLVTHRVDIDRLENGVLVETHELNPSGKIHVLRHASRIIVTNAEDNIPVLAKAAMEQTTAEPEDISPQTYGVIHRIVESYKADPPEENGP